MAERGRPPSSERLSTLGCDVIDVRMVPALSGVAERPWPLSPKPSTERRTRHDLSLAWPNGQRWQVTLFTTETRPFYGGARRWFLCPACGRRCAKLYSPRCYEARFACRHCWRLVYPSQYEKDQRARLFRQFFNPKTDNPSARRQRRKRYALKLGAVIL
jgi:hypothetical protein